MQVTVVTLLVTPEQAERLALASTEGKIQLALRNPLDQGAADAGHQAGGAARRRPAAPGAGAAGAREAAAGQPRDGRDDRPGAAAADGRNDPRRQARRRSHQVAAQGSGLRAHETQFGIVQRLVRLPNRRI